MKKVLVIGGCIVVIVIAAIAVLASLHRTPAGNTLQNGATFPGSSTASSTSSSGIYSFLQGPDAKEDQNNPGTFYLGNQPPSDESSAPAYLISFNEQTHYFNIVIYQEPIGENRKKAEQYLQQKLGLTQEQMCSLKYSLGVPDWVNSQYSDMNLGFSFCSGAVQLPD